MLIAEEEKFNGQKVLQQVRNAKREIRDLIYLIHLGIPDHKPDNRPEHSTVSLALPACSLI